MDFRVLGPLEAVDDAGAQLPLGGPKQRALFAYLVLEANRVVSTDKLIDQIWGDEPPDAARQTLFTYVSRLRKLLGTGRIQARAPGYVLQADRREVDALRFADRIQEAHQAAPDRRAVADGLRDALGLWRGPALADIADFAALQPAIARLEEQHLTATEDLLQVELDLGLHREVLSTLDSLTREHPLRERLWTLLITALYRAGRQADALGAFHRARRVLAEELGIEPSAELTKLNQQVLQQDPTLIPPSIPLAAQPVPAPPPPGPTSNGWRRWRYGPLLIPIALVLIVATTWAFTPRGLPQGPWTIGVDMPLTGPRTSYGQSARNAIQLAVDEVNAAGGIGGVTLALDIRDDGDDPGRARATASDFVEDRRTIAMVGPWGSAQAFEVIPLTNAAGLITCSPAATHPGLTKPRDGALDLRSAEPDAISFVRLAPADDIQAVALAAFAFQELQATSALVIDDGDVGRVIADPFEAEFRELGGSTIRRTLNPEADAASVLTALDDAASPPGLVFAGGRSDTVARIRSAMVAMGHAATPLLSWDFIMDGNGDSAGSYLNITGDAAAGTYAAHASLPDHKFSFADAYRQEFGAEPDEYAAAGYACIEIIGAALRQVASQGPTADELRALLRASVVDPTQRYETILGTIGFDDNGDALQQFVTFYRVDPAAADGAGDWVVVKKQDFGPAR
jgi:DNA-binding SARP family transcriptional activator/ABC-type branched-subunit amino acid transport system substrate-binding protein